RAAGRPRSGDRSCCRGVAPTGRTLRERHMSADARKGIPSRDLRVTMSGMKALAVSGLALVLTTGVALADPPAAAPASAPAPSSAPDLAPAAANDPAPGITQALSLVDVPPRPPLSLRIEALRIATERVAGDWPYPEPADIMSYRSGQLFFGAGHY